MIFKLYRSYLQAPEHPAKLPLSRWVGAKIFPKEGIPFKVDRDILLYLHPDDWLEYMLIKTELYEPLTLIFIEKNLFLGQTSLFAGTNFGLHIILASRCAGDGGCVIGVEPQPRLLYKTHRNIMLNNLPKNIQLVSSALGSQSSLLPMDDAPYENSGTANLIHSYSKVPFYVYVESLPNLLQKLGRETIDVMLLDVEGYELNVLSGLSLKYRPALMIIEVNPSIIDIAGQISVYKALESLEYTCWTLEGNPASPGSLLPEQNVIAVLDKSNLPNWVTNK